MPSAEGSREDGLSATCFGMLMTQKCTFSIPKNREGNVDQTTHKCGEDVRL